jgi:hypothetical protein
LLIGRHEEHVHGSRRRGRRSPQVPSAPVNARASAGRRQR